MNIGIGDRFIINWKKIKSVYKKINECKYENRGFMVSDFSKSGLSVYYNDNKTNNDCKCAICANNNSIKSIAISYIIITETRIQYERNKKINQILK